VLKCQNILTWPKRVLTTALCEQGCSCNPFGEHVGKSLLVWPYLNSPTFCLPSPVSNPNMGILPSEEAFPQPVKKRRRNGKGDIQTALAVRPSTIDFTFFSDSHLMRHKVLEQAIGPRVLGCCWQGLEEAVQSKVQALEQKERALHLREDRCRALEAELSARLAAVEQRELLVAQKDLQLASFWQQAQLQRRPEV
jgi:hypothetical protein